MRVALAHMYTFRFLRGIERYVVNMANALARQGAEAVVVTGRTEAPRTADRLDPRVSVHAVPHYRWHKVTFVPGFLADFLGERYDALSLMLARGEGWAAAIADRIRPLGFNIVFHFPGEGHEKQYRAFARLGLARRARHLIAVSHYVARDVERWFGRRATVIPNGVDADKFRYDGAVRRTVREELGLADDDWLVITVGSIEGRKGTQHLIAAMPRLLARARGRRVLYAHVGDGAPEQRAAFEAHVRRAGIEPYVRLLGFKEAPERYYSAADAFVMLSHHEAFGIVAIEALATGLPVVVSEGSAFPEIVPPGVGRLVPPDDPDRVADALGAVLAAGRPGEAARRPTISRFAWDAVAARYLDTVREAS
ncbi:MAG TPA: glycosyltransferase family 4 protein [Thermodesulfobacteriota bacterium]